MDNPVRIKMENDDDYAGAGAVHMFGAHAAAISSQYKINSVKNEPCEAAAASGETSRHYPLLPTAMTSGVRDVAAPISCEAMRPNVNNNGGAHELNKPVGIKTPKYSGRSDWEAFHAQFELLAHAYAWSEEQKALQLALCLTDDALSCLLLLDISERADYGALVGALRRRFGQCFRSELLRSELHSRQRIPGEPLRALANDIESLARRAYAHLRIHTQLARPHDLAEALELALEREMALWTPLPLFSKARVAGGDYRDDSGAGAAFTQATDTAYTGPPLLGMWSARAFEFGKQQGGAVGGTLQTPESMSCSSQKQANKPTMSSGTGEHGVVVVGRTAISDFCHIPICIEGVECTALVDTGSTVTVVRPEVVPEGTQLEDTAVQLRTVTGELAPMKGKGLLTLSVAGVNMQHPVWIANVQDSCILGLDFLRDYGCRLDLSKATLSFSNGQVVKMSPPGARHTNGLAVGSWACHLESGNDSKCTMPPSVSQQKPLLMRTWPGSASGSAGDIMGELREIMQRSSGDLDMQQQDQLWELLVEFQDCFACNEVDLGQTSLVQHNIDTGDATPIRQRPRRMPLGRQEAAEQALSKMQRAGIIELSESPWASPVVMVPKKGGEWRFCVDYRRLNAVTRKDSYPLPRVDECLDLVAGSSWFSSLDLRSGYWQVPLTPEARPKTAFCTGRGLWQFKVLSFGLCNAPATFERLMERVLEGVPRQQCLVFLDDILAHGASFHLAITALRAVLEKIRSAGLKLHPNKCRLLSREVTFLGHRIGSEGIGTAEDKVRAVREWPVPANQRELKSFLGLASYYRKFVRGFSCIAAPLYKLLQKDQCFVWSENCQNAFDTLKQTLVCAPILAPPDPQLAFVLDTDASGDGIGAVLSQVWPDGEKVVAYYSKVLSKAEKRYCVTRRELLAAISAIRHFKYYLCGWHFTIRSDHASLQWLMTFKEPEGQVARWLEELQSYEFTVTHRAGERHGNADALSRRPCSVQECKYCERREARELELSRKADGNDGPEPVCRELREVDVTQWADAQRQDPDLQPVILWMEAQQRPPWEKVAALSPFTKGLWAKFKCLRLIEGVLQRAWVAPATGEKRWQVVVPGDMQEEVLKAMHGSAGSGHFGVTKTLRRLRQAFYWGRLRRDVEDFCRRCDLCTARKGPQGQSRAQLQQFSVGEPMQRVGIDIMGPFPRTTQGNRFVLTAMDYFTKWPEAFALPDQEAETVANALVEGMFSRFGVPQSIHSDQGRNFESKVFSCMCSQLGINKTRTTPLHPQSDGLVERFNRTLAE
ncbi:hypothetical protein M9458_056979 [Cirrhinus mrigala]|uniref:Gypsy retrotransposon integrase-like protein 1 n=1 Tax=Cirrhinus mrigala TaxID=683832 RepID=A0ABD0MG13_CIRMR